MKALTGEEQRGLQESRHRRLPSRCPRDCRRCRATRRGLVLLDFFISSPRQTFSSACAMRFSRLRRRRPMGFISLCERREEASASVFGRAIFRREPLYAWRRAREVRCASSRRSRAEAHEHFSDAPPCRGYECRVAERDMTPARRLPEMRRPPPAQISSQPLSYIDERLHYHEAQE